MRIYARVGVGHAWRIAPEPRTLEVFRLERRSWVAASAWAGDETVRAAPFEAIDLELDALWLPDAPA